MWELHQEKIVAFMGDSGTKLVLIKYAGVVGLKRMSVQFCRIINKNVIRSGLLNCQWMSGQCGAEWRVYPANKLPANVGNGTKPQTLMNSSGRLNLSYCPICKFIK
jgi:hypothetical protein